jgi:Cdc6-like AAA superfamily ATPase
MTTSQSAAPAADRPPLPISGHVAEALMAAVAIAANRGSPSVRSRHLLEGALSVSQCSVVRALADRDIRRVDVAALSDQPTLNGEPAKAGQDVGSRAGMGNDSISKVDQLDFEQYALAFAELIESGDAIPPLTIGIYGAWGMGKSFLLERITSILEARNKQRRREARTARGIRAFLRWLRALFRRTQTPPVGSPPRRIYIVSFNAWEYSASEVVWPGLVRKIIDQLEERSWRQPSYWTSKFKRAATQLPRGIKYLSAVATGLALGLAGYHSFFNPAFDFQLAAVTLLALAGGPAAVKTIVDTINPVSTKITALFQQSNYGKQIGYMAEIKQDLQILEGRLQNEGGRILVVVDDLDRCEPEKAVEVLQAVNLLLHFETFIVCLGIDARVISRAVERHYRNLLGPAGASGYEYLDKIVQIPFWIPTPTAPQIKHFLNLQLGLPRTGDKRTEQTTSGTPDGAWAAEHSNGAVQQTPPISDNGAVASNGSASTRPTVIAELGFASAPSSAKQVEPEPPAPVPAAFTETERDAFEALTPYLKPNPRHLKRLVNVYRLVRTLAARRTDPVVAENLEGVLAWLTINAQWPYAAAAMLTRFDALLAAAPDGSLPATSNGSMDPQLWNSNILAYLLREVEPQLALLPERLARLDYRSELLRGLVQRDGHPFGWEQLRALRKYTINFNPAIEGELVPRSRTETVGGAATRLDR